jgi:2-polyprenyl-6-methoxyphenol hydroxylase-like FAD-dependent oxidoreductase
MSIAQGKEGVMIRCSDGTTYHGDILVGADGAYSGVRQGLYKLLQAAGTLPKSDTESLSKGFMCLVGTTGELDPEKYPVLKEKTATLNQVIGNGSQYTVRRSSCYAYTTIRLLQDQHSDRQD